ncbi:MAG: L-asparaginase II [Planctomycetota bacterium]
MAAPSQPATGAILLIDDRFPTNPILCRVTRGGVVESIHRGAWCVVDSSGTVLDGAGDLEFPFYARSSIKALQALPLLETGAAERFGYGEDELALAIASHNGEAIHTERVGKLLARMNLGEADLLCGSHLPMDSAVRFALRREQAKPNALHNNCSGKHAGFLALALHLGANPAEYLEPDSPGQTLVREAIASMAGRDADALIPGIDGCSAPNYRLPLASLALAFARLTNPDGLTPERRGNCLRLTAAAAAYPELVAGSRKRLDTDLMRATGGRLFAKIGAEAIYVIGQRGGDRALALKVDDGGKRGLDALVFGLLDRLGWLKADEREALAKWCETRLLNHAGLEVGSVEVSPT